jgi:beta-1,4-mannosyl-glycoprotein beta-1,4-N-acetylglucosaminyltransferase
MIVDGFTFYNELDMLKYRLETLYPVVDKFVLVESPLTHRGNPKKLYYQENKHLFEKYSDKIIHLVDTDLLDNPPTPWLNEGHQRNYIVKGLESLRDDDIVLISDVDEIFDPEVIKNIDRHLGAHPFVSMKMDMYYYNIESKQSEVEWTFPKAIRMDYIRQGNPPTNCRTGPRGTIVPDAGWHLSYFGNPKMIINKLKNFAHDELSHLYNYTDEERVMDIIKNGQDIARRPDVPIFHVPVESNPRLPPNYQTILTTLEEYDTK